MLPDDVSLFFLITIVALVHAAILAGALRLGAPRVPALYFIAGCLLLALSGATLFAVADPGSPLRALGLNVPPLLSYAAWLAGMLVLCGEQRYLRGLFIGVAVVALVVAASGLFPALRDVRIAAVTGTLALLRLATAAVLLRYGKHFDRRFAFAFAAVLAVEALAMGDRALQALGGSLPSIAADPRATTSPTWLAMLVSALLSTPLLLLLGLGTVIAATRDAAARYRATLDALPDTVLQLDPEGRVQGVHRGAALAAAEPDAAEAWRGRPLDDLLPPVLVAGARQAITEADSPRGDGLAALPVDDGEARRWVEVSAAAQRSPGDLRPRGHVVVVRDVSARVRAESDLHYRIQLLERLVVNSPIGLLLSEARGGLLLEANPAFLQQCGWSSSGLRGCRYADLLAPAGVERAAAIAASLAEDGRCGPLELPLARGDGGTQPVLLSAFTLSDAGGRRLVWTLVEDIAERQRVARLKSELVSVVSHELRTPLTSIMGALGLVVGTSGDTLSASTRKLLDVAGENCRRLRLLVDDLLDLDRLIAGKLQVDLRTQPLQPLLAVAVETLRPFASAARLQLVEPLPAALLRVDAARFQQLLANLISNALKFSPAGGEVLVEARVEAGRALITVSDRGPGVPEEFVPHLFERFAQADASDTRARGGSGLGLAIVRGLSEQMGGEARYRPNPGGGAQFELDFPVVAESAANDPLDSGPGISESA